MRIVEAALKNRSFFKIIFFTLFVFLSGRPAQAQWSPLGGGACDMVYALSPDVAGTGIYAGMNYNNCTPGKNYLQHSVNGGTPVNLNANAYVNGYIFAIAVSGNNIYLTGSFTSAGGTAGYNGVACWNTSTNTWSTLGSGLSGSNKTGYALAVDAASNKLYIGGEFTSAGGTAASNIACWNIGSSSWSALGAGMTTLPAGSAPSPNNVVGVYALTVCGSNLFAGGRFVNAGGTGVNNIASWNGSSWSALGSGITGVTVVSGGPNVACAVFDAAVMALTNDGTTVYVGGDFSTAGGTSGCGNIAAWNTTTSAWSKLGAGMSQPLGSPGSAATLGDNANVWALTMYNGNLIAGGDFEKAGTVGGAGQSLFVALWNGSAWSKLSSTCGHETDSDVFSLTTSNGVLYVGGQFDDPAYYIAEYTGGGPTITMAIPPATTICPGGTVALSASGNATSYTWTPAASLSCSVCASPVATPTATTTYTVTGIFGGCTSTKTITITVNPKPTLTITPTSTNVCTGSSSTLTAGGANTYTWSPAATLSSSNGNPVTATPTANTTYTLNGTDGNGCSNSKTITLNYHTLPTLTLTAASPTVCNGSTTSITASGASTYTWSPGTGLSSSNGSPVTATVTATANYTVTGTDAFGCVNSQTVAVNMNPLPNLTVTATSNTLCSGTSSTLTASGATSYTWSPAGSLSASAGTSVTATPPAGAQTYTVNGTDGNGCKNKQTITINVSPTPTMNVSSTSTAVCSSGSTTLSVAGSADTYTWSPSSTLSSSSGTPVTATPTAAVTYSVTGIVSATGCKTNSSITITITPTPSISINAAPSFTICKGNSTTLTASGGTTFTWSPAATLSASSGTSVVANPTTTTVYNISGMLGSCVSAPATVTVTVDNPPDISVQASPHQVCAGNSSTLTAMGNAITFTWSPAATLSNSTGTPVIATPPATTEYTVVASGANTCTASAVITITVNTNPTVTVTSSGSGNSQAVCSGEAVSGISFSVSPSANTITSWTNTNTSIGVAANGTTDISGYTAPNVTSQQTGVISVVATNSVTGCSSSATNPPTYTVTINPLPNPAIANIPASACASNSLSLSVSPSPDPASTYTWTDASGSASATTHTASVSSGIYTVTLSQTDANGCSNSTTSSVTVNSNPVVAISGSAHFCKGSGTALSASPNGGGFSYQWTNGGTPVSGATSSTYSTNAGGTYGVIVTNTTTTCFHDTAIIVKVDSLPKIDTTNMISLNSACGQSTGSVTNISVTPTATNNTYSWTNSGTGAVVGTGLNLGNVPQGNYCLLVTDSNNCQSNICGIKVNNANSPPIPVLTTTNNTYCAGQTVQPISVSGTGTFTWYSDAPLTNQVGTGSPFTPTVAVTTTLYVTATASACPSLALPVVITINPLPTGPSVTTGTNSFSYCQGTPVNPISINPTLSPTSTPVWYSGGSVVANGSSFTPTVSPTFTGQVIYTVKDSVQATGCVNDASSNLTVTLTINPTPNAPSISTADTNYCVGDVIAPLTATTTPAGGHVIWYQNGTYVSGQNPYTPNISNNAGTYVYIAYDSSSAGCISAASNQTLTLHVNPAATAPQITSQPNSNITYCGNQAPAPITATVSSGTVLWYENGTLVASGNSYTPPAGLSAGTHTYSLIDSTSAGCKNTDSTKITVSINANPVIGGVGLADSARCSKNTGSVTGLSATGSPVITYQWVDNTGATVGTSPDLTNVGAGTYSLIVTDGNGCKDTSNASFTVGASTAPTASFTPSVTSGYSPLDVSFTNNSVNATSYSWNFGTNTTASTQQNPSYTYTSSGTYTVVLTAYKGNCLDRDTAVIYVEQPQVLIIPNIFSPNGDGTNDDFFINSSGLVSLTCDIFNRWGELVYKLNTPSEKWDGVMNNGNTATEGTYMYILEAKGADGTEYKRNGPLTLVR